MFLERSLNDPHPPPPHFKHPSLLPPSPSTTPSRTLGPTRKSVSLVLSPLIMSYISVRSQFSKLIWNGDGGISQTFEHYNHQNLTVVCSLVVHLPSGSWSRESFWFVEVWGVITSKRKIVYRLHDQAEDEESKSLPITDTLRNMTIVLYKNYK